jgi:hypothetical protein
MKKEEPKTEIKPSDENEDENQFYIIIRTKEDMNKILEVLETLDISFLRIEKMNNQSKEVL